MRTVISYRNIRNGILIFACLLNAIIPSASVGAALKITSDPAYRANNDVLYTDDSSCGGGSGTSSSAAAISGDGGGCGNKAPNDRQNMEQIWGFFVNKYQQKGYSQNEAQAAAAGIMGNMRQESQINPAISGGMGCNSYPAVGIVQWCGGRQDALRAHAEERGQTIECLGVQLEYIWKELEEGFPHLFELMKISDPRRTAAIFDHGGDGASTGIQGFEESIDDDNSKREQNGADIYEEMTGTSVSALSNSSSSSASCGAVSSGGLMSADCKALVEKYKQLRGSGKLKETDSAGIDQDIKNCTEGPIECGVSGGSGGGVHPLLLRAVIGGIENSGGGELEVWNMNTRHPCDGLNHPKGRASDIVCNGNPGATPKCNDIFKFYYNNYDELKLSELIWYMPPDGIACGGKVLCMSDHADHIHIGVTP